MLLVALLTESVDRNRASHNWGSSASVALLTESVDRNAVESAVQSLSVAVALLTESVDRNGNMETAFVLDLCASLSSRRAWIEITGTIPSSWTDSPSLSSRRAWIEIARRSDTAGSPSEVALLTESVDRNSGGKQRKHAASGSLSSRRAWIEIAGTFLNGQFPMSLSSRRAWIEMFYPRRN